MSDLIKKFVKQTSGKKTFTAVLVGIGYIVGASLGLWEYDSEIGNAIILAAIAALRMGVSKKEG